MQHVQQPNRLCDDFELATPCFDLQHRVVKVLKHGINGILQDLTVRIGFYPGPAIDTRRTPIIPMEQKRCQLRLAPAGIVPTVPNQIPKVDLFVYGIICEINRRPVGTCFVSLAKPANELFLIFDIGRGDFLHFLVFLPSHPALQQVILGLCTEESLVDCNQVLLPAFGCLAVVEKPRVFDL